MVIGHEDARLRLDNAERLFDQIERARQWLAIQPILGDRKIDPPWWHCRNEHDFCLTCWLGIDCEKHIFC
jgi:hypothetical protein